MKKLHLIISFCFLSMIGLRASAQNYYTISGTVTDDNQKPLAGATVFADGTQIATATDNAGKFNMVVSTPGSYHISVRMLGYALDSKDVLLKEQPATLNFTLALKPVILHEVNIGSGEAWAKNYAIFEKEFMGSTKNSRECIITNPHVLYFSTQKNKLYAQADDFLIIENKRLGYHIKYLLKTFEHNPEGQGVYDAVFAVQHKTPGHTAYSGEVIFEELPGTDAQKQEWAKNRLDTYNGSLMHFLRSVFTGTWLKEGFLTNIPVQVDSLPATAAKSFVSYKQKDLYVTYAPQKVIEFLSKAKTPANNAIIAKLKTLKSKPIYRSELQLFSQDVLIDSRGSIPGGYLVNFLIRGDWINKRVGDQLPFEYQPPITTTPSL